jgi:hypothetical protein
MKTANKQILGGGGAEGARATGQGKLLPLEEMARRQRDVGGLTPASELFCQFGIFYFYI